MNLQRVVDGDVLSKTKCKNLVLTNYGMDSSATILLPTVGDRPLGPIIFLGAEAHSITVESVERDKLISPDGPKTKCTIPAESCVGSETAFTNLFGEAWQVSSNVPLLFE